jgi:excisionase family DNA binding protein
MSIEPDQVQLLTIAEAAKLLKIAVPMVRRLQQQRQIPYIKVGGSVRFAASDITAYLEKRKVRPIDQ